MASGATFNSPSYLTASTTASVAGTCLLTKDVTLTTALTTTAINQGDLVYLRVVRDVSVGAGSAVFLYDVVMSH
jgi:hypothetical protein